MSILRIIGYIFLIILICIGAVVSYLVLLPTVLITGPIYLVGFLLVIAAIAFISWIARKK